MAGRRPDVVSTRESALGWEKPAKSMGSASAKQPSQPNRKSIRRPARAVAARGAAWRHSRNRTRSTPFGLALRPGPALARGLGVFLAIRIDSGSAAMCPASTKGGIAPLGAFKNIPATTYPQTTCPLTTWPFGNACQHGVPAGTLRAGSGPKEPAGVAQYGIGFCCPGPWPIVRPWFAAQFW